MSGARGVQNHNREFMRGLPKIARQRLAAEDVGTRAETRHPEAELLAAFSEQSFGERQRAQIVDHLSKCGDCREIVFLSVPEIDATQVPLKLPDRASWLSWPALRWSAVAVCMLIVGCLVVLRHDQANSESARLSKAAPVIVAKEIAPVLTEERSATSPSISPKAKIPEHEAAQPSETLPLKMRNPNEPERRAISAVPQFAMRFDGPARPLGKAPGATGPLQNEIPSSPVPSQKTLTLGARLAKSGNQALKKDGNAREEGVEESAGLDDAKAANPSPTPTAIAVQGAATSAAVSGAAVDAIAPAGAPLPTNGRNVTALTPLLTFPRWMLTSDGALQRSFDQGHTWERISVAVNLVLHTLSVRDAEVWVGGPAGALYHSSNSGQKWTQVIPVSKGEFLNSDVEKIEFVDSQNGVLTTASREHWITTDFGKTWQKQ